METAIAALPRPNMLRGRRYGRLKLPSTSMAAGNLGRDAAGGGGGGHAAPKNRAGDASGAQGADPWMRVEAVRQALLPRPPRALANGSSDNC